MLTDLNWMTRGNAFPPKQEEKRLKRYKRYKQMFNSEYDKVYGAEYANRANYLKLKDVNVDTVINYPQLLAKKTADFVCGEPVEVDCGDMTDTIKYAMDKMSFDSVLYEAMIDVSRYGNAIVKVLQDRISAVPVAYWYPIVDLFDKKHIVQHVLAFQVEKEIYVEIHDIGKYERRVYEAVENRDTKENEFGNMISSQVVQTGLDDFAVQVLSNTTTSDKLYGTSDYAIIDKTLEELLWRIYCAERILDKHAAPSMAGPRSMLQKDEITGRTFLSTGNFFAVDSKDTPVPQYITWDGNLDAVKWEIEWLTNQLYTLSEMGAAFLEGAGQGEVNSGRALRLRMTSPLIKARRLAGVNTNAVKTIIALINAVKGNRVSLDDIAVTWNDGLPNDWFDEAEVLMKATGGKPFMSQLQAVKIFNELSDEGAELELASIETQI